ncbi:MAG TPA: alpha/beta fold hydrolase [Candidatus Baltobacteraceae bacterium]|nr:alpha/beta fold hydrolase [Candidatus Baltobacteraceae bacterium]
MSVELLRARATHNEVAVLHYVPRRPRNIAIVAGHGYSSSKHNLDMLCSFLAGHGFSVYSLDFPGHKLGASGGTLRGVEDCIDAMSAVLALAREMEQAPVYTLGHSMGATTALFTAANDPQIRGVVAIATGYGRPSALSTLRAAGATDFRSSYVDGVDLPTLVEGIDGWYARLLPKLAGRPQLYVAATRDAMVNASSVRELYDRAPEPKTFASIESDHTYAGENARAEILTWFNALHPR